MALLPNNNITNVLLMAFLPNINHSNLPQRRKIKNSRTTSTYDETIPVDYGYNIIKCINIIHPHTIPLNSCMAR